MSFREYLVTLESRFFDLLNGTRTTATRNERLAVGHDASNGFWYIPTRPSVAREILRTLPIGDPRPFTFIDVGCGKGRMLTLAARHGFHLIVGIELDSALCAVAQANIAKLRDPRIAIEQTDARNYAFPPTPLVLYLFNPFGENILQTFLDNLVASLNAHPRPVVLALMYPEYAYVVDRFPGFKLDSETPHCRFYRN